jgi:hypothetical protein
MKRIVFLYMFLFFTPAVFSQIPELNAQIVEYVETVIGTKVDRGECWDLAYRALNNNNARWDGKLNFGKKVDPYKDEIFAGDIIQFKNVKTKIIKGNTIATSQMKKHTAIIYKVYAPGKYQIAHQNTQKWGKKVALDTFDLKTITSGNVTFFRPQK